MSDQTLTGADVRVAVVSRYLPEQSEPTAARFAFAYTVTIANAGAEPVQLLSRYWRITDGNAQVREVSGRGVVGELPHIAPGESFEYTSGAVLETDVGSMEGHYDMVTDSGRPFMAPIAAFLLARPGALH